ncbi:MAG: hypothetical protein ACU83V_14600 [Gammaproteobacteria bacterium]
MINELGGDGGWSIFDRLQPVSAGKNHTHVEDQLNFIAAQVQRSKRKPREVSEDLGIGI